MHQDKVHMKWMQVMPGRLTPTGHRTMTRSGGVVALPIALCGPCEDNA